MNLVCKLPILFVLSFTSLSINAGEQRDFSQCINDWQQQAKASGLSAATIEQVIPSLKHLPKVIGYDQTQPEFSQTFAQYLNRRLTPARLDRGIDLRQQHNELLNKLAKQYGVPGRYLVSFWGLETNFGRHMGKLSTLNSLATLACDPRRSDYFTEELLTALKLMERESLTPKQMQGSWAGAMGHTQFMPSAYYKYAVDGDNDGRIDLWHSKQDALTSGANFLQHLGWQAEQRWGREIELPKDFPYAETGLNNRQPLSYWVKLGVKTVNQKTLPATELMASVLVPAGHKGPAFLVYPNFNVIMKWNHSESYALSVGLLADQIAGYKPLTHPPSLTETALSRQTLNTVQTRLNALGFDAGKPDGVMGSNTRSALSAFQTSTGLIADGYPDELTRKKLTQRH